MSQVTDAANPALARGNTRLDLETRTLRGECAVTLPPGVTRILAALMRASGLVGLEALLDVLWEGKETGPTGGIVGVYLCHARGALRHARSTLEIVNHRGRGWEIRLRADQSGGQHE